MNWEEAPTYYEQPIIKEPVWTWEIPCYFFTGGMGGAAAGLALLSGMRGNDELSKRAWLTAMAGISASPLLLISDLGKPTRFINMLRMFKPTSPMSVGSWILSASGATTAVAAAHAWTGMFPRAAAIARPAAALLGLPLSTYTAALVSNTAVPVWHEAHDTLPFVFATGAALSAGAATAAGSPPEHAAPARRLALGGAVLELAAKQLMEKRLGEYGEAYKQGAPSIFSHVAEASIIGGAALMARSGASSRRAAMLSGALMCAGALAARWSVFKAGFVSARQPKYTAGPQRERIERGQTAGAARTEARVGQPRPEQGFARQGGTHTHHLGRQRSSQPDVLRARRQFGGWRG